MERHHPARRLQRALLGVLTALAAGAAAWAAAAADVATGPRPGWALPPLAAAASPSPTASRVLLASDSQVRVAGARSEFHEFRALRVQQPAGLREAGVVAIDYAPDFQRLTVHSLQILRGGIRIDLLPETAFRVVNRERQFSESVVTGRVTALAQISDLRVGDVLEYAYTLAGANPVFGDTPALRIGWDGAIPVGARRVRILDASSQPAQLKVLSPRGAEALDVRREKTAEGMETLVLGHDLRAVYVEPGIPLGFDPTVSLQYSGYANWSEVSRWAQRLFAFDRGPSEPALAELTARLRRMPRREAVAEAVRFVQDDIRYFSVSIGESSHRPQPPGRVVAQRYGDCKDKSVLLAWLLREIGVEATPMLVSTFLRGNVDRLGPTPVAFDHVIVRFRLDGRDYWIDATRTTGGTPFDRQSQLLAGARVLPVAAGTDALATVPQPPGGNRVAVRETVELPRLDAPAAFRIETTVSGVYADAYRASERGRSPEQRSRNLLEAVQRRYPEARAAGTPGFDEQRDAGSLRVDERYEVPSLFRNDGTSRKVALFGARQLYNWLGASLGPSRTQPFAIPGAGGEFTYELSVRIAEGVSGREDPVTGVLEAPQFRLETTRGFRGDTLRFQARLTVREGSLAPGAVNEYRGFLKKAEESLIDAMLITPDNMVASDRGAAKPFAQRLREEFEGRLAATGKAIDSGRLGDAEAAETYVARGLARVALGDLPGGIGDFNAALRLRPSMGPALSARGTAQMMAGSLGPAEADLTRSMTLGGDIANGYLRRGHVRFLQGRFAEALEDFQQADRSNEHGVNRDFILIWRALATLRLGRDARPLLADALKGADAARWPVPLLRMLAGQGTPDDMLRSAGSGTEDERVSNLCEAYFYAGQYALAKGDRAQAETWFRKSIETGVINYIEYELARAYERAAPR